jgi:DNA-binding LacI/PurR family transcriptional regulator
VATIVDVAEHAGVSIKTVSRVINGTHVRESTRAKVLAAMTELDYVPSIYARGMAGQRNWIIGVYRCNTSFFSEDLKFYTKTLDGFEQHLAGTGYRLLLDSACWRNYESGLNALSRQVDGVLMLDAPNEQERKDLYKLIDKVPLVTIGQRQVEGKSTYAIGIDNCASVSLAVKHLFQTGHANIGLIVEGEKDEHYRDRIMGYNQAAEELGLLRKHVTIIPAGPEQLQGLRLWLEAPDRPAAVVVSEERTAMGLLQVANSMGVSIPGDLEVITYEDTYAAKPAFTLLRRHDLMHGKGAAQMLLQLINGEPVSPKVHLMPAELVLRTSG